MLPSSMTVNKKLLPIKGHFFLFNAGTAPLVPYLSTYARQLGFSSATVGLIYTLLPIFGLIAKPLFGVIADKCKVQKSLFITFQVVTIISFAAIYFIPESSSGTTVELDCNGGVTMLRGCYASSELVEKCKVSMLGSDNSNALCDMKCDMSSPKMWQTLCEHWQLPQYCFSNTDNITYSTNLTKVTLTDDKCANISTSNVLLDGYSFVPRCRVGLGYVDVNEPCYLNCTNTKYSSVIGNHTANMTCVNKMLNYRLCPDDGTALSELSNETAISECEAFCALDKLEPWRLMEICDGWEADVTESCQPRTKNNEDFPTTLSFVGIVTPISTIIEHNCVHVHLKHIEMPDGSTHYPNCIEKSLYQTEAELFHTSCEISCNNSLMNEIFQSTSDSKNSSTEFTLQFQLFFTFMIISWIGQAVVVTFADAICFNLLGNEVSLYGKQRLWGSVGWGIFSLMTGSLIDVFSDDGAKKDYTVAFVLMFVFMMGDVVVSCFIKNKSTDMSLNILADVGSLLSSLETCIFVLWTIGVGFCTGLLWQFLFWHLEDIAELTCDGFNYVKTLQGLVSAIQTFGGEIPFMFVSGFILRKLGHINMMSIVLFSFGVRFLLYSWLTNPWWVLPIEMFQGITYGMFYPTLTSYANIVSPPGTETTIQGLVGAIFEGVGVSLGSLLGGRLYETYGGWNTFRWFGIGSLILCGLHVVVQYIFKDRIVRARTEGYSSVIRYEQPNDMVFILEDMSRDSMYVGND